MPEPAPVTMAVDMLIDDYPLTKDEGRKTKDGSTKDGSMKRNPQ